MKTDILHSIKLLYLIKDDKTTTCSTTMIIKKILDNGIKIDIFYTPDLEIKNNIKELKENSDLEEYRKNYFLNFHEIEPRYKSSSISMNYGETIELNNRFNIKSSIDGVICIDGKNWRFVKILKDYCNSFNYEQYAYEHVSINNTCIIIKAGAGAGKTTTTNQRVIFLNHCKSIPFEDIHQITFTRDAAKEMNDKLIKQLRVRKKVTKDIRSIKDLNDQSKMKISTIDSYLIEIAKAIGPVLGYNKNTKIKSFIKEKKELIKEALEEEKAILDDILKIIPLYKLEEIILSFWDKINSIGLTNSEIASLDWGTQISGSEDFNNLLKEVLKKISFRLSEIKMRDNTAEIHDYTTSLRELVEKNDSHLNDIAVKAITEKIGKPKVIIIDEMQDSNLSQIKIFSWLCKHLDTRLEVVGDIKQSIYRFRGSNYTAMTELKEELINLGIKSADIWEGNLEKNYRTEKNLLDEIQNKIDRWTILTNKSTPSRSKFLDPKLEGMNDNNGVRGIFNINRISSDKYIDDSIKWELNNFINGKPIVNTTENLICEVKELLETTFSIKDGLEEKAKQYILGIINNDYTDLDENILDEMKNIINAYDLEKLDKEVTNQIVKILNEGINKQKTVTVLVRYNYEAIKIKDICTNLNIPYKINIKGNFYRHRAVLDFKNMLSACNEIENKDYRISFKESPYTIQGKMSIDQYNNYIYDYLNKYKEKFKKERFYTVVNEIINANNLEIKQNYYNEVIRIYEKKYGDMSTNTKDINDKIVESANLDADEYMENLYKLIELLQQSLGHNPTVHEVCKYLEIQIYSNYEEEEIRLRGNRLGVECYTVHAAKGMEYKNVLIPYTNNLFFKDKKRNEIIIDNNKIGWNITYDSSKYSPSDNKYIKCSYDYKNDIYENLIKNEEIDLIEDEKRLLYVALTRAKESLTIILLDNPRKNTWGYLIDREI